MAYASFQHYLKAKRQKLAKQQEPQGTVFHGLTLYFNGVESRIKEAAIDNGATNQDYLNRGVDVIIAEQMTLLKQTQLKKPVVRPQWIIDCIAKRTLLPQEEYELYNKDSKQQKFKSPIKVSGQKGDLNLDDPNVQSQICTAPGFIQRYFETSRLHHLSTWKQELIYQSHQEMWTRHRKRTVSVEGNTIMHVDMDCFFASVMLRDRPDLQNAPVVIAHSAESSNSTAEVASCNYIARSFGVKNGSIVGNCKKLCPELIVLPYDFTSIKECTDQIYQIFYEMADFVQAVSCDEAFLAVGNQVRDIDDPREVSKQLAQEIRKRIFEATRCTASIGIGNNMLTARIATKKAKPDGIFYIHSSVVCDEIGELKVSDLPGVGWATSEKLEAMNVMSCLDLRNLDLGMLKSTFGEKQGVKLFLQARGVDNQALENKIQTTVGSEINWAIRFRNMEEYEPFVMDLCQHVFQKMENINLKSRHITVTAKKRNYVGEPSKYLGCGHCVDYTKSQQIERVIKDPNQLFAQVWKLLGTFNIPAVDVRGVGIHLKKQKEVANATDFFAKRKNQVSPDQSSKKARTDLSVFPRASQIDQSVLNELPPSLQMEQMQLAKKKELESQHVLPTFSQIDPEVLKCLPKHIQKEQLDLAKQKQRKREDFVVEEPQDIRPYQRPCFCGETDFTVIMSSLRKWVTYCKEQDPLDDDVVMLSDYLVTLIHDQEMSQCCQVLRLLSHGFGLADPKGKSRIQLKEVFHFVLENVNQSVKEIYGNFLHPKAYL